MTKEFTAIIEKTSTGFSGYFKEIDGIISVGESIAEIKDNLIEALDLTLDEIDDSTIEFKVDLGQFFEHYSVLNKSAFAEYIGMNKSLFRQYTSGLTKLSDNKLLEISKGLHKLADDFSHISLVR